MIVASGYKVWPREVEDTLVRHPAVREAAVVGVPDSYRGETVWAYVSLRPGASATPEELTEFCRAELAAYKYPRRMRSSPTCRRRLPASCSAANCGNAPPAASELIRFQPFPLRNDPHMRWASPMSNGARSARVRTTWSSPTAVIRRCAASTSDRHRRDLRAARPQRRREDDDRRDPRGLPPPRRRRRRGPRLGPRPTAAALKKRIGIVLQSTGVDRYLTVAETVAMYARYYPHPRRRSTRSIDLVGLRREADQPGDHAVRRPAASTGRGDRAGRRPGPALPRRADDRLRPVGAPRGVADREEPRGAGQDGAADDPLHGRGAEPRRPGGGDRATGGSSPRDPRARSAGRNTSAAARQVPAAGRAAPPPGSAGQPGGGPSRSRPTTCAEHLHRLTGWAMDNDDPAGQAAVTRPSLEDVYLADLHRRIAADGRRPADEHVCADLFQIRYVNKAFWRNPASAFFTFAFPLMFLVIFTALLGHGTVHVGGTRCNSRPTTWRRWRAFAVITPATTTSPSA